MAARKSKDELKKEADAVKAIFEAAKKKEHNCAMVLCGDGSLAIEADPRLPVENLFKKARKRDGATPKGVMGLLNVKGTDIELVLTEEPPGGLEMKLRQYLTSLGVKMKPTFIVPGAENADGAAAGGAADAELSKEQLTADLKHMSEILKLSFKDTDEETVKSLTAALKNIAGAIASGDLTGAQNIMNKLTLLTGVGPDSPLQAVSLGAKGKGEGADGEADAEARKKTITAEFQNLKSEIQRSVRIANPAHKTAMETLIRSFGETMKAGDLKESEAALEAFKERIASFDRVRDEGRRARAAKYNDIVARIAKLKDRLESIKAEGRAV